ncbi:beta family protein [Streptomyces sp. NBC_00320]|nr:beta family protein [Streptomyces sp. NBC_00320]
MRDHRADKCALRALELLGPLTRWRSIVLLAGSFPPTAPEPAGWGPIEAHRHDWDVWHMVRHARPELPVDVTYGDYGAHRAFAADGGAGGGPPWGVLRYTTDRTLLLAKAPTIGEGHAEEVREIARRMVAEPDFRGAGLARATAGCTRAPRVPGPPASATPSGGSGRATASTWPTRHGD